MTAHHLPSFQFEVGAWGDRTFPHATNPSIVRHLIEEVGEILQIVERSDPQQASEEDLHELGTECADVLLLLLHLAHRNGLSLTSFAGEKFTSTTPNERGYFKHTEEQS